MPTLPTRRRPHPRARRAAAAAAAVAVVTLGTGCDGYATPPAQEQAASGTTDGCPARAPQPQLPDSPAGRGTLHQSAGRPTGVLVCAYAPDAALLAVTKSVDEHNGQAPYAANLRALLAGQPPLASPGCAPAGAPSWLLVFTGGPRPEAWVVDASLCRQVVPVDPAAPARPLTGPRARVASDMLLAELSHLAGADGHTTAPTT